MASYMNILVLLVLFILSAIFSSSETALTAIKPTNIKNIKERDSKKGALVKRLKQHTNQVLSVILIGNNIVNVAATAIVTQLIMKLLDKDSSVFISTTIMTILIVVFGEITPKTFATQNPEKIITRLAKPLDILVKIFKPVLFIMTKFTNAIIKLLGGNTNNTFAFITEEEIKSIVDVGEEEGILEHHERVMIDSIFDIDETDVTNVMVPRIDIIAASIDSTINKVLDKIIRNGHSRIPIYEKTIDNIIGVLYAKDMLPFVLRNDEEGEKPIVKELMRSAHYVPQTKKIGELLKEMQNKKVHMAIVLDEYGATEGLVTIEDILEEIVGDILDEYDAEENLIEKICDNKYNVKADIELEEFNEIFGCDLPCEELDSLGGYIFNSLGRVAREGDIIKYKDIKMRVSKVFKRRILYVEVEK